MTVDPHAQARDYLRHAHALHEQRRIDDALGEARRAIDVWPEYVDAWSYLGTTLITRRLTFPEGLAALERAYELAPDDAGIVYGLGWCYEFVAYRLQHSAGTPYRDPIQLYRLAAAMLQRCIDLNPEKGLRDDAEDLLASIEVRLE
ncbi:MAG TPA: tetratricopeptide repeat protein [Dehalococcoidia bacterium]|nr:tetratricopeptide repeat protein [Dehalococcoidia bacterium]